MDNMYDKSDMKAMLKGFSEQVRDAYNIDNTIMLKGKPDSIIVCGMGGSSISGQILESFVKSFGIDIPIFNVQDYQLPAYVSHNSVIFINSYSGNTEETISCYREALKKGFNIIIITTGGKLKEYAELNKKPIIIIPKGLQPRNAIAYMFFPLLKVLENSGIIGNQSGNVKHLIDALHKNADIYDKSAKELSEKLYNKLPVIYSSNSMYPIAYRWKTQFNENTKLPAFCNRFPELNHNELNSYVNAAKLGISFHLMILKDEHDNKRIIKRMDVTKKIIKEICKDSVEFTELNIKGDDLLTRMFTTIYMGDLITYYLALKYATDPSPVELIEKFKKELGPFL